MWIIAAFLALTAVFWALGWKWEQGLRRPAFADLTSLPLVSILIPAYNSEHSIEETLRSVKDIDYPKKEILVVNDSQDSTPAICRRLGVPVLQNKGRAGKAMSLNKLAKRAKGEVLLFIDADTTVPRNCLKGLVPWFSRPGIAAVSPRWVVKNRTNLLTRLISLENRFIYSFFKTHMFFGSLVSFRGCAVAVRRSVFEELGGWPNTLIEDSDLSGIMLRKGYKIQYEPSVVVQTSEPTTLRELGRQRFRWGKGSIFSFFHHYRTYSKNSQFLLYFIPYIFLLLAVLGFVFLQTTLFVLPFLSLYLIYSFTIKEFLLLLGFFFLPLFSNIFTSVATGSIAHMAVMTAPSRTEQAKDVALVIPYVFFFIPAVMFYYLKGVISGIRDKKHKRDETDLSCW